MRSLILIVLERFYINLTPPTVDNLKDISINCWLPENSIEDFLDFLKQQRQTVSQTNNHESFPN